MKCWLVLLIFPLAVITVLREKCTEQDYINIDACTQIISKTYSNESENKVKDTPTVCERGYQCFDKVDCKDAARFKETLRAGCEYDIFLSNEFKECREIIKSQTECMDVNMDQTAKPCAIFKSMLECVLPNITEKCGDEQLSKTFAKKFKHHNNMSFQCGL